MLCPHHWCGGQSPAFLLSELCLQPASVYVCVCVCLCVRVGVGGGGGGGAKEPKYAALSWFASCLTESKEPAASLNGACWFRRSESTQRTRADVCQ